MFFAKELDGTPTEVSAFIDEHRGALRGRAHLPHLGVSASAHYQRATGERSARELDDEQLVAVIREVHEANFEAYGYRTHVEALRRRGRAGRRAAASSG